MKVKVLNTIYYAVLALVVLALLVVIFSYAQVAIHKFQTRNCERLGEHVIACFEGRQ